MDEKGQYLASCDDSGEICCVELSRAKCVSKVTPHDNICASVQWVPSRSAEVSMDPARTYGTMAFLGTFFGIYLQFNN